MENREINNSTGNFHETIKQNLKSIFNHISKKFQLFFLKGLANMAYSDLEEVKEFNAELKKLDVKHLISYIDSFYNLGLELVPQSNQGSNLCLNTEKKYEIVPLLISQLTSIFTYIRVYERVQTKSLILQNLQSLIHPDGDLKDNNSN